MNLHIKKYIALVVLFLGLFGGAWACSIVPAASEIYIRLDDQVYFQQGSRFNPRMTPVVGVDAESFVFGLEKYGNSPFYGEDGHHVFYKGTMLEGALPTDVKMVGNFLLSNHLVFSGAMPLEMSAEGFEVLEVVFQEPMIVLSPPPCGGGRSSSLGSVLRNKEGIYALTNDQRLISFKGLFPQARAKAFLQNKS